MKYRTIVADPPWDHSDGTGKGFGETNPRRLEITPVPYGTMTLADIAGLPVRDLTDTTQGDAYLYLWTTSRYLPEAFGIARAWGFAPSATLVWCKAGRGWSLGGAFQNNVEFVIYGTRRGAKDRSRVIARWLRDQAEDAGVTRRAIDDHFGFNGMAGHWMNDCDQTLTPTIRQWAELKRLIGFSDELDAEVEEINAEKGARAPQGSTTRWFTWPRGAHSQKPEAFLDIVEQVSPGPRLEMFARRQRLGWDTWGNEALNHVEMPVYPNDDIGPGMPGTPAGSGCDAREPA